MVPIISKKKTTRKTTKRRTTKRGNKKPNVKKEVATAAKIKRKTTAKEKNHTKPKPSMIPMPTTITLENLLYWFRQQHKTSMTITEIRESVDIDATLLSSLLKTGLESGSLALENSRIYVVEDEEKGEEKFTDKENHTKEAPHEEADDIVNYMMGDVVFT